MSRISIIIALLLNSLFIQSQDISVNAWFDTTRIYIGDQVGFNIEIEHPSGINIVYPYYKDTLITNVEIINSTGPDTISEGVDNIKVRLKYLITSFDSGSYEIDPVYVETKLADGVKRDYSDYNLLEVLRIDIAPADSTDVIFDIAGPRRAGITFVEILPWLLIGVVLVIVTIILIRYFRSKKGAKPEEKSYLPLEPYHIIALRDLDKLDKKELWQKSNHKLFYSELTEILRTYIERRYSVSSLELTSSETLTRLLESGFEKGDMYNLLAGLFNTADLAKFAKYIPGDEINVRAIADARTFVKATYIIKKEDESDIDSNVEMEESDE